MTKSKKNNPKPKGEEKPDKVVKEIKKESPKKKKDKLKKVKAAIKTDLVEIPEPAPVPATVAEPSELKVKKKSNKKSKSKKKNLKDAPEAGATEKVAQAKEDEVKDDKTKVKKKSKKNKAKNGEVNKENLDTTPQTEVKEKSKAGKSKAAKKDAVEKPVDPVKQAKKEKRKLKQKSKKAEVKQTTAASAPGPGQTLFVGNVPSNTKRVQLFKLFTPFGKVLTIRFRTANGKVIFKHKMRRESAALNAYVVFDSSEAATKALELNGTPLKGQILRVQKPESSNEASDPKNTVFVGNLKYSATDDKLHQIFSSCGEIEYVRTLQSSDKKGCIGTAFVCFKSPDAVGLALELKGTMLDERPIHVERYSVNKLGAKEKRDADSKTLEKGKPKGGKPLERAAFEYGKKTNASGKKQKFAGKKPQGKHAAKHDSKSPQDEKKKKSEYRGVKADKMKKKPKKKIPSQMKRLANKIAPKE
ncbi:RNA-binding protein 34 [Eupeodes corollae]|uniref:RNA-binding protein 34 n=1 Tax=Eupeodes corollae TaxID=290404 RepID=UPI0024923987|nr:RNA-binding protein 34 [Eupeodes corollae]